MAELAQYLEISPPAAYDLIVRMERAGLLRKTPGAARSMVPVDMESSDDADLDRHAKRLVLLAFRNGPIEDIHAGWPCPNCSGKPGYSRITDEEMKTIMKTAANRLYSLMRMKEEQPDEYARLLRWADLQIKRWDPAEYTAEF